jgi:hypothetical protein
MRDKNDDLAEAKRRVPLPTLLHQLGLGEHAKKSARCTFHDDQRNSFSVWRGEGGKWFWKCHAGCGDGDEVTFLEKIKSISRAEAIKLLKEMAGVGAPPSKARSSAPAPDWRACVEAFDDKHLERLADWRGFSGEFCSWLKRNGLVGLYEKCIAFPVHDGAGNVAAVHYRLRDGSWRYYPPGVKVRPLVIGELVAGDSFHVFESQWDTFAFLDSSGERSGVIISRGAGNAALVGGLLPENSTVYLWPQNDPAGDKWEKDICANTHAVVKRANIPAPHKDLNDWTKAGATDKDLLKAVMSAETIRANEHEFEPEPEPKEDALPEFPVECLPPILERQARAISELCGVPLAMSAPMVLAVASASIGKGLRVRSLPGKVTPGNLFVLVCKTSGSGGSLTFKYATAPLVGMQKTRRREFEEKEKPQIDAERAAVSSRIDELKRKLRKADADERKQHVEEFAQLDAELAQIEKRVSPILYVTDITSEKLADMLAEHGETLAHIDSDAADALGIITGERYGDGRHTQESVWLKSYTGEATVVFRKNVKDKPIHLDKPCLAVLFVATPDIVQKLFGKSRFTSGGLLPRFLVCDPAARPVPLTASVDMKHALPTDVSQQYEAAIFVALSRYRFSAADDPDEIDMVPKARGLLIEDWNCFCAKSNGTEDCPFEARHTENAIRIALVFHAFRHVEIEQRSQGIFGAQMQAHNHAVDERSMRDALRIRDWFNRHQDALRTPQRAAAEDDAWHKTQAMLRDRSPDVGIVPRDLYNGRRVCSDSQTAQRLLTQWKTEARIESFERKPDGAGRPTIAYRLAPLGRR